MLYHIISTLSHSCWSSKRTNFASRPLGANWPSSPVGAIAPGVQRIPAATRPGTRRKSTSRLGNPHGKICGRIPYSPMNSHQRWYTFHKLYELPPYFLMKHILIGGRYTYPSEKYDFAGMMTFPTE